MEILLIALVFIVCGLLAKRYPMLISGYNMMSAERKKNVDVKGLSTFVCYSLVGMGVVTAAVYGVCILVGAGAVAEYCSFIWILYLPYLLIRAQKYDHNVPKRRGRWKILFLLVIVFGVIGWVGYSLLPVKTAIKDGKFIIGGMYGKEIPLDDIRSVQLVDTLPELTYRLNGLSLGSIHKGWFKEKAGGKCLLFLSSDSKPIMLIRDKSGHDIYINMKGIEQIYTLLKAELRNKLSGQIQSILKDKDAVVGVAVLFDNGDTLTVNNQNHYPMMSVLKFPLALAVLDHLDKKGLPLSTEITVVEKDLLPDTYSPLRDKYPQGGVFTIAELLKYTISLSDNNTCDILFRYVGGTEVVQRYVKALGVEDMVIVADEGEMCKHTDNEFLNWSTPFATVYLLELFRQKDLFAPVYKEYLHQIMIETGTGLNKIKGLLPKDVVVGHKTGSSSRDESGRKIGDNDMGFVLLPDGRSYQIAIFVTHSMETDETNAKLIAEISKAVYDYYK